MKKCLLTIAMLLMVLPFSPFTEAQAANDTHLDINEKNIESYKEGIKPLRILKLEIKFQKLKTSILI